MQNIHIAAAAIIRPDGKFLLVRKKGTDRFMQAGGKLDAGETAESALARELMEELALDVNGLETRFLGQLQAPAANEAGMSVVAEQFVVRFEGELTPMAELEEALWVSLDEAFLLPLAPLLTQQVIPLLKAEGLL